MDMQAYAQWMNLQQQPHPPQTTESSNSGTSHQVTTNAWNSGVHDPNSTSVGPQHTTPSHQPSELDLNFGDMTAVRSAPSPVNGTPHYPYAYFSQPASTPYTYPYVDSSWSQVHATNSPQIPQSRYSTLQGAVTPTGSSQPPSANDQPPPPQHPTLIDPALVALADPSLGSLPPTPTAAETPISNVPTPVPQQLFNPMAYSNMFTHAQTAWPGFTPQYAQQMMALQHLMPLQGQPQAQDGLNPSTLHDAAQQITSLPPSSFYLPTPASVNPPSYLTNFATHPPVASTSTSPIAQGPLSPTASRPARSEPIHIPIPGSSTSSEQAPPLAPLKPTETPEERRAKLQAAIKPHIQANAFSGAPAVNKLIKVIEAFGLLDVDVAIRREVLGKIRDKAGNHYFRAWSENQDAMDVTREWLKAAIQNKDEDEEIVETIMPLLQIIDRLPMTLPLLTSSKLAKLVVKLVKDPPDGAIKDMASKIEAGWRKLVSGEKAENVSTKETKETQAKSNKRKAEPAPTKATAAKRQATAAASSSKPLSSTSTLKAASASSATPAAGPTKKVVPAAAALAVKTEAKTDSSFFSAPKQKAKLPSFNKVKSETKDAATAGVFDPFKEALAGLTKGRKGSGSPANATTPPPPGSRPMSIDLLPVVDPATLTRGVSTKTGRPKKVVSWAGADALEQVKFITKAIYDDDELGGFHTQDLRDLDRAEGASMHIDLSFEETIDWYEPSEMGIPPEMDYPRGGLSTEKVTQAQREQSTVGAFYMSAAQIPDTPTEPAGPLLTDAEQDQEVKIMEVGEEHAALFGNGQFMEVDMPPQRSVAELLGQLAPGGVNGGPVTNGIGVPPTAAGVGGMSFQSLGFDPNMLQMMHNMPPEQLQQMLSNPQENMNMNPFTPGQGAQPPPHYGQSSYGGGGAGEQPWMGPPYGQSGGGREDWEDRNSWDGGGQGGFRGAGRGRGQGRGGGGSRQHTKRIPCSFFAQGRCRYGDDCNFSHEL